MSGNEDTENIVELAGPNDQEPGIVETTGNQEPGIEVGYIEPVVSIDETQSVQNAENTSEQNLTVETIQALLIGVNTKVNGFER